MKKQRSLVHGTRAGTPADERDPVATWRGWLDHQYDPGYWVGERVPPIVLGPRPNPLGYLLVLLGSLGIGVLAVGWAVGHGPAGDGSPVLGTLAYGAAMVLLITAGLALLRPRTRPTRRGPRGHR